MNIVGGGLAGVEAAYQILKRGGSVTMYEMRPSVNTPAHRGGGLAELVCSNSLKSDLRDTASGLLKCEMRAIGSIILEAAEFAMIPAGSALAVDKKLFSDFIEERLRSFKQFKLIREEVKNIDPIIPQIIAAGPLASPALSEAIAALTGRQGLHFYDAVAPVIATDSIDINKAFYAARYDKGDRDYINCPMSREEYDCFYKELVGAQRAELHEFDKREIFEGCMPIEVMAARGYDSIRFGPLRPVGIRHPETGDKYFAVVQLRKENKSGTMYNIVGFQTNLTFNEQKRVFSLIPGLERAEFLRFGVMHRNTYLDSPNLIDSTGRLKNTEVYFAGQITGVEGYVESAMSGMLAGINAFRRERGLKESLPPRETIMGALAAYIATENENFQPMNANFGLLPYINIRDKKERKGAYTDAALHAIKEYLLEVN